MGRDQNSVVRLSNDYALDERRISLVSKKILQRTPVAAIFICAQIALISGHRFPSQLLWPIIASVGGATVLSYATLAECFSKESAGQANGALNILHIGGAFVIQYVIGYLSAYWPSYAGHYPAIAYQAAFAVNLTFQIAALAYFVVSEAWPVSRGRRATVEP